VQRLELHLAREELEAGQAREGQLHACVRQAPVVAELASEARP
jgi:hypothetical protein